MSGRTVYFNEDNHHFYEHPLEDMTPEGVRRLVDFYAAPGTIKGILFCTNVQRALYDSDVWERFRDIPDAGGRLVAGLRRLAENGVDQFVHWLDQCRERGIEGWLTMRMNDSHGLKEAARAMPGNHFWWPSQKWRDRSDLRRAPHRDERSWEGSYNYGLEEVREHHLALVREILDRYDPFGLELDWMRWGFMFAPGMERESRGLLTGFVREVRLLADAAERRRGHRIQLAHRIPAEPQSCLDFGFDVPAWSRGGMVDMITLSSFLGNSHFDPPVSLWKALLAPGTPVNVYVEPFVSAFPDKTTVRAYEFLYGAAAVALAAGADGLYLFNECYRESDAPDLLRYVLERLGSAEELQKTPRRLPVSFPSATIPGTSNRTTLPQPLSQAHIGHDLARMEQNLTIRLSAGKTGPGDRCFLRLAFSADARPEDLAALEVRVNGTRVETAAWPSYPAPQMKWITPFPSLPGDAKEATVYEVPTSVLHATFNAVEVLAPAGAPGSMVWGEFLLLP